MASFMYNSNEQKQIDAMLQEEKEREREEILHQRN
jgi:hypothetical protein